MNPIRRIQSSFQHGYEHITFSKYASWWFIIITIHCILHVSLQAVTLIDNKAAADVVNVYLQKAGKPDPFMIIMGGALQKCPSLADLASGTCQVISTDQDDLVDAYSEPDPARLNSTPLDGNIPSSTQCLSSLFWLGNTFRDAITEDIVTLCFHFWLFVISLLAILNDSIPHLAVSVASHFLDTAWASFRVKTTVKLQAEYDTFIVRGACNGTDILGDWWGIRLSHAIPIAVCNFVVLVAIIYLSWMLFWSFVTQTFSRVGMSPVTNRVYKLVLCFEAKMGLATFFGLASTGMWADRMYSDPTTKNMGIVLIITAVIWLLWILSGSISIRREIKWLFLCFGLFHSFILAVWVASFANILYRYEINTWPFFSCISIASFVFQLFTGLTGCICRLNYGKGLAHFLQVQAALDSAGFAPGCFAYGHTLNSEVELQCEKHSPKSPDYGLNRGPFVTALKRLKSAARTVIRFSKRDRIDFGPNRLSQLDQPKFKLPIQPTPAVVLPPSREPTLSMFSESSIGSTGDIIYASRSPLMSATARTLNISRGPRTALPPIDDEDKSPDLP